MFVCIIESLKLGLRCRMSTCMSVIKNSVQQIFIEQLEFCSNFRNRKKIVSLLFLFTFPQTGKVSYRVALLLAKLSINYFLLIENKVFSRIISSFLRI